MKLLIITSRFPYPLEKGDKLRIFHQIRALSIEHEIHLFSLNDSPISEQQFDELKPYCNSIKVHQFGKITPYLNSLRGIVNKLPFQVNMFINNKSKSDFDKYVGKIQPDHIYCQLVRTAEYGKLFSAIPKTLDYMDCFSNNMLSRKKKAKFYEKPVLQLESNRLSKYEKDVVNYFNNTTIISEIDKTKIKVDSIVIKNGVDFNYFNPTTLEKNIDLLFVGNMKYPPNIDTCEYIAHKIVPKLINRYPNLKVCFAGSSPSEKVKKMTSKNIEVTGWVDDIREYYKRSKVFIAPMELGTGLQNKILEAMAMKVPVITSKTVNKSIKANNSQIIECTELNDYVSAITQLLNNNEKRQRFSSNAFTFVTQNFDWKNQTNKLSKLFSGKA